MTTWVANTFNIGYSFLQGLPATKIFIFQPAYAGRNREIKKVPISTNVLTDTVKTLITVFGTQPNSDTNTIIIADYFPIVNLFA